MSKRTLFTTLGLLAGAGLLAHAIAEPAISRRSGITALSKTNGQFRLASIPFTRDPVTRSVLVGQSGSVVTVDSPTDLTTLTGSHALRVLTGANKGRYYPVASFPSATTANVSGIPGLSVGVDEVEIYPLWTLDTAFPAGGNFTKSGTPGGADIVYLTVAGSLQKYFYNSSASQWRSTNTGNTTNQGFVAFDLNGGFMVQAVGNQTVPVAGTVVSGNVTTAFQAGKFQIVGLPHNLLTANTTLGQLFPNGSTFTKAGTPGGADVLYLTVNGNLQKFFYNSSANQWRSTNTANTTNQAGVVINRGDAIMVQPFANGTITLAENFAE